LAADQPHNEFLFALTPVNTADKLNVSSFV
jgi:hypothetical protein